MANSPSGKRYSDKQIAAILRRASELQQEAGRSPLESGIGPDELVQIGNEVGIDSECIRKAIREVETSGVAESKFSFFGGPTRVESETEFPATLDDELWESMSAEFRRTFSKMVNMNVVGGVRELGGNDKELDPVHLSARQKGDKVHVRVTSDLSPLAVLIWIGFFVITLVTCLGIGQTKEFSELLRAALIVPVAIIAHLMARGLYSTACKKRRQTVLGLVERLDANASNTESASKTLETKHDEPEELRVRLEGN